MSKLPRSWTLSTFGELNRFESRTLDPSTHPNETFDLYSVPSFPSSQPERVMGSQIGSTKQTVAPDDVLVCKINPRINRTWHIGPKGEHELIASSEWIGFRSEALQPRFAKHYFASPSFRELLCSEVAGVGGSLTRAQPKKVATYPVPVAPLAEQTRIADELDKLLARIQSCNDRLDTIPALLKRLRQAVLDAATSGSLTEDWNAENKPTWAAVRLSDVAGEFSYGSAAKSSKTGSVPVLRMGNIQSGRLDWTDLVFTSDQQEIDKYRLRKGDVLFNRTNSPELVGKTAIYQGEREAIYAGYLIRVRCLPTLLPEYLNYCLGSKAGRAYCWSVKSDGVSQSNINAKKLAAFEFLLPSMEEQAEVICRVDNLQKIADRIEASYLAAKSQAQRLTSLLLAKAFRGDLVSQDPEDESADSLLKRIKENWENQAPKKMKGRAAKDKPMKSSPTSRLQEVISQMDEDCFTFDQLREVASRDYETLKDELYLLLADSGSGIKQVFDVEKRLMKFKRVRT